MIRRTPRRRSRWSLSIIDWFIFVLLIFFLCVGVGATTGSPILAQLLPSTSMASISSDATALPTAAQPAIFTTMPAATSTRTATTTPTTAPNPTFSLPTSLPTPPLAATPPILRMPSKTATVPPLRHFVANEIATSADCGQTIVQGIIHDELTTLNGVRVRVWWPNAPEDRLFSNPSGTIPELGSGRYQVILNDTPKAGAWLAAVVDEQGRRLSEAVQFYTTARGCDDGTGQQVINLDFWRREGTVGIAGATLTPIPAAVSTLPPTEVVEVLPAEVVEVPPEVVELPLATPDGVERTLKVPILMFHYISVPPEDSDIYRHDLSVGPNVFRAHLITLREQGYTSITLSDLLYAIELGKPLPEKPVVLTFDDGYRDNYTNAFPIMKEEGFVGNFFVITNLIEEYNENYMTWEQLREMQAAGMEIGSHTKSHADLPGMPYEEIWYELAGSRTILEHRLGQEVRTFCYPFGKFDPGVAHLTKEAGYWIGVSTKQGLIHTNGNIMTLRRVRVRGGQFPPELMKIINYWMNEAVEPDSAG